MAQAWCRRQNLPPGEMLTLERLMHLSELWYHDRLAPDFRGRTREEAVSIFTRVGLTSDFWR